MIAVTGSTGTVGSAVVSALSDQGLEFVALVRDPDSAASKLGDHVRTVACDLSDPDSLDRALRGVEAMFLLTPGGPATVEQAATAVGAAVRAGVAHVVRLSALGADLDAPFQIGRWHAAAEGHVRDSGIPWTILQPDAFMQNLLAAAPTVRERGELYSARGTGKRALIDARDIGAAAAKVLADPETHIGATYRLTGGEALSDAEVAEHLSRAIGRPVRHVPVSPEVVGDGMRAAGLPEWLIADLLLLDDFTSRGLVGQVDPALGELLGRPPITFAGFTRDHAQAFGG